jgi:hypothetical protein
MIPNEDYMEALNEKILAGATLLRAERLCAEARERWEKACLLVLKLQPERHRANV